MFSTYKMIKVWFKLRFSTTPLPTQTKSFQSHHKSWKFDQMNNSMNVPDIVNVIYSIQEGGGD